MLKSPSSTLPSGDAEIAIIDAAHAHDAGGLVGAGPPGAVPQLEVERCAALPQQAQGAVQLQGARLRQRRRQGRMVNYHPAAQVRQQSRPGCNPGGQLVAASLKPCFCPTTLEEGLHKSSTHLH